MRLYILKDGTIPVAVAKVVAYDEGDKDGYIDTYNEELIDVAHDYVEAFEVEDDTTYLAVSWDDTMGFEAIGYTNLDDALEWLNEDATDEQIAGSNLGGGHWAITYGQGDDESYAHIFTLG